MANEKQEWSALNASRVKLFGTTTAPHLDDYLYLLLHVASWRPLANAAEAKRSSAAGHDGATGYIDMQASVSCIIMRVGKTLRLERKRCPSNHPLRMARERRKCVPSRSPARDSGLQLSPSPRWMIPTTAQNISNDTGIVPGASKSLLAIEARENANFTGACYPAIFVRIPVKWTGWPHYEVAHHFGGLVCISKRRGGGPTFHCSVDCGKAGC